MAMPAMKSAQAAAKLLAINPDLRRRYSPAALKKRLRRNTGLRIISLLLAIGLWFFVNAGQRGSVQTYSVPIGYRGLPAGFVIANQHPDFVKIQVSGPSTLLSLIDPRRLTLRIDLSGVGVGQASFKIGPDAFNVPRQTGVTGISPSQIVLDVDKYIKREVPVHLAMAGEVSEGYKIASSEIAPRTVIVRGPSREVGRLDDVETEPLDVSELATDTSRDVLLVAPNAMIRVEPTEVTAKVTLIQVIASKEFRGLPVEVRDSDYAFKVNPAQVNLTVRGPLLEVAKLDLKGAIFVEADGLLPGSRDLPVQVKLPDGIEVVHQSAQKVKLRMYRDKQAAND
jgi:YbbR domain-containing protein